MKVRLLGGLLLIGLVVGLVIALRSRLGWQSAHRPTEPGRSTASRTPLAHVVLKIEGMDCVLCAAGLQNSLRALKGVRDAQVSFQDKQAAIDYDPNAAAVADFEKVIANSGFRAATPGP